jgi:hypothetical protein
MIAACARSLVCDAIGRCCSDLVGAEQADQPYSGNAVLI